jgi:hypothetical protein
MKDFKPIRAGTLTVRFMARKRRGDVHDRQRRARRDLPARPGHRAARHVPGGAGAGITAGEQPPRAAEVVVFAQESEIPHEEEEDGGGIAFLKEQQWQIAWEVRAGA